MQSDQNWSLKEVMTVEARLAVAQANMVVVKPHLGGYMAIRLHQVNGVTTSGLRNCHQ